MALESLEWLLHWEVHGEPTVHLGRVLYGIGAVEYLLVKFCSEVTSEAVDLALFHFNCEYLAIEHFHGLLFALG